MRPRPSAGPANGRLPKVVWKLPLVRRERARSHDIHTGKCAGAPPILTPVLLPPPASPVLSPPPSPKARSALYSSSSPPTSCPRHAPTAPASHPPPPSKRAQSPLAMPHSNAGPTSGGTTTPARSSSDRARPRAAAYSRISRRFRACSARYRSSPHDSLPIGSVPLTPQDGEAAAPPAAAGGGRAGSGAAAARRCQSCPSHHGAPS